MPYLSDGFVDAVREHIGPRVAKCMAVPGESARDLVEEAAARFTVNAEGAPVATSDGDPIIDLGGRRPNEGATAVPVHELHSSPVGEIVSAHLGYTLSRDTSAGVLYSHRFVDSGFSARARAVVTSTCPAVCVLARNPTTDDLDLVVVDAEGPRTLAPSSGRGDALAGLDRRVPTRSRLFDTDPASVIVRREERWGRVPVADRVDVATTVKVTDGSVRGARQHRLALTRAFAEIEGMDRAARGSAAVDVGLRSVLATPSAVIGVEQSSPYAGGPDAPVGFVWGDPGPGANCSRSSRDACLSCCDTILAGYAGAAITSVATGTGIGAAAAGVGAVPGLAVGAVIGGVIMAIGLVHSASCRSNCSMLYATSPGAGGENRNVSKGTFYLTAADYSASGEQVAYVVEGEDVPAATWSRDALMQLAWSGAKLRVRSGGEQARVVLSRRPAGTGFYLRSNGDRTKTNNLGSLPQRT